LPIRFALEYLYFRRSADDNRYWFDSYYWDS